MRATAIIPIIAVLTCLALPALAGQSVIVQAEGFSCMGDEKSRSQTRADALADAKRKAADQAGSYVVSETSVKDYITEKDVVDAYSRATVKILQELESRWEKDPASGECYHLRIKAEVIPDEKAMRARADSGRDPMDDPSGPLAVKVWTDRESYRAGERMKIFLKGNKPFYARVVYRDAKGALVQLLPNIHRTSHYFNGGTVYEIPSGRDAFTLEVTPPFGRENITVYAGTQPLGDLDMQDAGGVYLVRDGAEAVGVKTRGVMISHEAGPSGTAEFVETGHAVATGP